MDPVNTAPKDAQPISKVMSDLAVDSANLARQELALAKVQINEASATLVKSIVAIILGGAVCTVGLFYLIQAIVFGLSEVMPEDLVPWLPSVIVGVAAILIGYLTIVAAKKKMEPSNLVPHRSIDSIQKDARAARGELHE